MAESVIIVCDRCGKPAVTTATLKFNGSTATRQVDLCARHAAELKGWGHRAKRGRRAGQYA